MGALDRAVGELVNWWHTADEAQWHVLNCSEHLYVMIQNIVQAAEADTRKARTSDPDTSQAAADKVESWKMKPRPNEYTAILSTLEKQTTGMAKANLGYVLHAWSGSRVRTAISDLGRAGMIRDTGDRAPTPSGGTSAVVTITERGKIFLHGSQAWSD